MIERERSVCVGVIKRERSVCVGIAKRSGNVACEVNVTHMLRVLFLTASTEDRRVTWSDWSIFSSE